MTTLLNIAKMTVTGTPGTGNITLGSAVTGWQSFAAAGATNGMVIPFNAVDGSNQQDGTATYSTTGPSLTGISITDSTTGSPLSLTSAAIISATARAQDIVGPDTTVTLTNKTLTSPVVTGYTETLQAPAAGTAFTVAPGGGTIEKFTSNGNLTVTLPSSVAGVSYVVIIAYGGVHTLTWAGGSTLKWAGGNTPTPTSVNAKFDIFTFLCDGTNTYGFTGGLNF